MATKRQVLRQIGAGGGLAAPALEIHHRDHLQLLGAAAVGHVAMAHTRGLLQHRPQVEDLFRRIEAAAVAAGGGMRPLPFQRQGPQVSFLDTKKFGGFGGRKPAQRFRSGPRYILAAQPLQLDRERFGMRPDLKRSYPWDPARWAQGRS